MAVPQPLVTIRLEPGYKFRPTDEDIMVHYLRPRALNIPPPAPVIVDVDILNHNPWDLVPEGSLEKYYFSKRVPRWPGGNRSKRAAGDGHWKPSGREVPIYSNAVNGRYPVMVGMKKTMVFYRGKAPAGEITEWVMQEYSLFQAGLMPCRVMRRPTCNCAAAVIAKRNDALSQALRNANASLVTPVVVKPDDSWVVCRIYKKKKRTPRVIARGYNVAGGGQVPFFDFIGQGGNNPDGTSSSSTLTGPPYEMEDDDTDDDGSSSSSEKDCSSEGN